VRAFEKLQKRMRELAGSGQGRALCRHRARLRVHDSYEALLADPGIDAVYIPLPNHLHVEWTLRAIAAGKHVLTEKPVAMAAAEIDRLIAARDASGLQVAEAYMIVHHPQWQRARALLAEGAIGTLRHVDGAFSYDNRTDPGNIRNRPETGGGGIPTSGSIPMARPALPRAPNPPRSPPASCGKTASTHGPMSPAGSRGTATASPMRQ
jgi:predicted dehydrogenase